MTFALLCNPYNLFRPELFLFDSDRAHIAHYYVNVDRKSTLHNLNFTQHPFNIRDTPPKRPL